MISLLLIVGILAYFLHRNWMAAYLILSFIVFSLAALTVYGGLTKSPELWPSEFWLVAGIAVNMVGVFGFMMVIRVFFKNRNV
jgi:hypothetical protein